MLITEKDQAQVRAALQNLLDRAPALASGLMQEFGCDVAPSIEALVLLNQVKGAPFTDELFILTQQVNQVGGGARYAAITGFTGGQVEQAGTLPQQRDKFGQVLQTVYDVLAASGLPNAANGAAPATAPSTGDETDAPVSRIAGLSQPVFIAGCVVALLLALFLLLRRK